MHQTMCGLTAGAQRRVGVATPLDLKGVGVRERLAIVSFWGMGATGNKVRERKVKAQSLDCSPQCRLR